MIRILQCVNDMHRAGLETMLMNYYRNIDRTKIQFDFLTHRPYKSDYDDEIEKLGGRVYYAPRLYPKNYIKYFKWMKNFFKTHPEYSIIHSHIDSMSFFPLLAAKKAGIKIRIAHSHNTSIDFDFKFLIKEYCRKKINNVCNYRLACGYEAGKYLFKNKNFQIIPNSIDAKSFLFNPDIRLKKRKDFGLTDEFIIGHVGRFTSQKNHKFLLEIFKSILKKQTNAKLMLVGIGESFDEIKRLSKKMGIFEKILFMGNRDDTNELYQVMDVFVMPSFYEGIPVVGIEAQYSGLKCFFSTGIPSEVSFTNNVEFLSIKENSDFWSKKIIDCYPYERKMIQSKKYDINHTVSLLSNYYLDKANNC